MSGKKVIGVCGGKNGGSSDVWKLEGPSYSGMNGGPSRVGSVGIFRSGRISEWWKDSRKEAAGEPLTEPIPKLPLSCALLPALRRGTEPGGG